MVRGLALAETTPGPLIMVVQFVAFVGAYRAPGDLDPWVAAVLAALLTTWVTFVPCFLFILLGAPYVERLRGNRDLAAALAGITAAVVGVIASLAVFFALHTLFDETRDGHDRAARRGVPGPRARSTGRRSRSPRSAARWSSGGSGRCCAPSAPARSPGSCSAWRWLREPVRGYGPHVFFFFSNRLGCAGSLLVSLLVTAVIIAIFVL